MGKPNRRHRAAKQRARHGGSDFWAAQGAHDQARQPAAEQFANAIMAAAMESAQGNPGVAKRFATQLPGSGSLTPELEHGARLADQHIITRVFQNGWLPEDIHQAARRRVDPFAVGLLTDVMAAYIQPFGLATIDETWRAQLAELKADAWWSESEPHLGQWAAQQLLTPAEALTTVIEALALLILLPKLELIKPLPGTARPDAGAHHHVDEKVLGRVRGLLAKAESTSFPEEAETLSAKAQELMTKYALDRVLVDANTSVPDLPGVRRIWLETPYVDAKAHLVEVVTRANRCRAIFASAWGFMTIVGDEADLEAVELLTTSLLVQATRAMIASGDHTRNAHSRSRSFRKSFLIAYAARIGERLAAATETTIAESADPTRLLPALASHQQQVDEAFENLFPEVRAGRISIGSAAGWEAGRAAADRAQLAARRPIRK
ncbi:DUF2786 domain-containing protein [Nocardia sp. NBC_00565]|uniref:DUF2786 domain-containing protein n=1 Tax=Nocardia sp. NBC_00565 TaxID=2975993 RepID=UPI002E8147B1|nr:DUF2786 domain-containing protein [Nocardia sp. NBC_00565]WUC04475.1 DUF2786 domain-containing protein [Nocardia sp. NBC_00565]